MATIPVILMVLAVVFLGIKAFKLVPDASEPPHLTFGWAGLFIWACVILFYRGADLFK